MPDTPKKDYWDMKLIDFYKEVMERGHIGNTAYIRNLVEAMEKQDFRMANGGKC